MVLVLNEFTLRCRRFYADALVGLYKKNFHLPNHQHIKLNCFLHLAAAGIPMGSILCVASGSSEAPAQFNVNTLNIVDCHPQNLSTFLEVRVPTKFKAFSSLSRFCVRFSTILDSMTKLQALSLFKKIFNKKLRYKH